MKLDFLRKIQLDQLLFFFSGGKDSIVMLDLITKYTNIKKIIGVFLYFIPNLIYKNEIISYYSKKYNVEIKQIPHPDYFIYQQNEVYGRENNLDRKYTQTELKLGNYQAYIKKKFGIEWGAIGYKRSDSITRARQFYKYTAIDTKHKYIYPVAYFTDNDIYFYLKKNKLKLPAEYANDFKGDITTPFSQEILLFLKQNYESDYDKIMETFPQLESIFV